MTLDIQNEFDLKKILGDFYPGLKITLTNYQDIIEFYKHHEKEYYLVNVQEYAPYNRKEYNHDQYFLMPKGIHHFDNIRDVMIYEREDLQNANRRIVRYKNLIKKFRKIAYHEIRNRK